MSTYLRITFCAAGCAMVDLACTALSDVRKLERPAPKIRCCVDKIWDCAAVFSQE